MGNLEGLIKAEIELGFSEILQNELEEKSEIEKKFQIVKERHILNCNVAKKNANEQKRAKDKIEIGMCTKIESRTTAEIDRSTISAQTIEIRSGFV